MLGYGRAVTAEGEMFARDAWERKSDKLITRPTGSTRLTYIVARAGGPGAAAPTCQSDRVPWCAASHAPPDSSYSDGFLVCLPISLWSTLRLGEAAFGCRYINRPSYGHGWRPREVGLVGWAFLAPAERKGASLRGLVKRRRAMTCSCSSVTLMRMSRGDAIARPGLPVRPPTNGWPA